tara:strand:+ start:768 stop:1034 length:267 start_codon:yes stop_codon:yes gene_type:complete
MAFKMKGNPFQRNFPNDIKPSPTKIVSLIIGGISAIAQAAKKNAARKKALRDKAADEMKSGVEGMKSGGIPDATKVGKFTADTSGMSK